MTGDELRAIRETLGLSASQLGRALGYSGATANISVPVRRFERGDRAIPPPIERLARMFRRHGIPVTSVNGRRGIKLAQRNYRQVLVFSRRARCKSIAGGDIWGNILQISLSVD